MDATGCTMAALRVSERRILDEPWREEQKAGREALTQALGRIGQELGWEAFLVPSAARRGGVNLIIFSANLSRRSSLEIINVGDLARRDQVCANLHADLLTPPLATGKIEAEVRMATKEQSRYNFPVFLRYDNRHLALGSASRRAL